MFATINPETIGTNLKRLIKESTYKTQEKFAEACFCDVRTVRRWISGNLKDVETISDVARRLDVDVRELLF